MTPKTSPGTSAEEGGPYTTDGVETKAALNWAHRSQRGHDSLFLG